MKRYPHFDYTGMTAAEILGRPIPPAKYIPLPHERGSTTDAMGGSHGLINAFGRYTLFVSGKLFETFPYTLASQRETYDLAMLTFYQSLHRHLEAERGKRIFAAAKPPDKAFPTATDLRSHLA